MLTFSDYIQLYEARKNPELNPKISPLEYIRNKLKTSEKLTNGKPNLFVSFTTIDKLGINPSSTFNTPIGVYSYPADYVEEEVGDYGGDMEGLPFAGDSPFVNIFSIKGEVLDLSNVSPGKAKVYYKKLEKLYPDLPVEEFIQESTYKAKTGSPAGKFYYVTMRIAQTLDSANAHIKWNGIFRKLGIAALYDPGESIIHSNEPVQCVVFESKNIYGNFRTYNKWSEASIEDGWIKKDEGIENKKIYNFIKDKPKDQIIGLLASNPNMILGFPRHWEEDFVKFVMIDMQDNKILDLIKKGYNLTDKGVDILIKQNKPSSVESYFVSYMIALSNKNIAAGKLLNQKTVEKIIDYLLTTTLPLSHLAFAMKRVGITYNFEKIKAHK